LPDLFSIPKFPKSHFPIAGYVAAEFAFVHCPGRKNVSLTVIANIYHHQKPTFVSPYSHPEWNAYLD